MGFHVPYALLFFRLQYTLPLSNTLYIRSNFSEPDDDDDVTLPITGNLRVGVTTDTSRLNATMTIVMRAIGEDALRDADVCLMSNVSTSTWGLSISVSMSSNRISHKVVLILF